MERAPFFSDVDEGPKGGQAVWAKASDGVRIRVGWWRAPNHAETGEKGTVLIFPGRTEYIEKYGRDAPRFTDAGYAVLAIDWRGQGIADRLVSNPNVGYVGEFSDYQLDVAAAMKVAEEAGLPRPFHVIGHSMGGCIALRAVYNGLPVNSAMFSAPMWGIQLTPPLRPAAWALGWGSSVLGFGHMIAPGTRPSAYVAVSPFDGNKLTTDADMYEYMRRQLAAHPELSLGGPALHWLHEALAETLDLAGKPAPSLPGLTFLGTNERIVDPGRIHDRMAAWPTGELVLMEGAEHEVMMETPAHRDALFARTIAMFDANATNAAQDRAKTA
jgi:lysophospholipase